MAARRISKTAVDWAAFAERVPAGQREVYRSFKAKAESYVNRIHQYPKSLPKIDFAYYKSRLGSLPMIDQFEKSYGSLEIKYPQDKNNLIKAIDAEREAAEAQSKQYITGLQKDIEAAKALVDRLDKLPPPEEMTMEMYSYYFPDQALDPVSRPTFFPHTPEAQPDHPEMKFIN
ncbi:hypothetical protein SNE40_019554 [Patella caerulea]|uniref:ATP synthase subunit d, mitochondrial n=1 Tax=Patella caerulea TaxID=87958 RepID=A0AAN8PIX8_PATCE